MPESQRQALSAVAHALARPGSVVVLTGDAGLGKTTVVNKVVSGRAGESGRVLRVQGAAGDMIRSWQTLCRAAGAPAATPLETGISVADPVRAPHSGVLVIDDAHEIRLPALRQLAASLRAGSAERPRPCLVLAGRSELRETLNHPSLSRLRDHITDQATLTPMSYKETERYIEHLFQRAGTSARALMPEATLRTLVMSAHGNLRQINAELARVLAEHRGREAAASDGPPAATPARRSRRLGLALAAGAVVVAALGAGMAAMLGPTVLQPGSETPQASRPVAAVAERPPEPPQASFPAAVATERPPKPSPADNPGTSPASQAVAKPGHPPTNALPERVVAELLSRGDAMLGLQDISAARRLYERAADAGSAQAAMALAATYDPAQRTGKQWDTEANKTLAATWYRRAKSLGAEEAASRLKQLGAEQAAR